jgi:[ribosomal protein S18]-alanine N-acetyltransferase
MSNAECGMKEKTRRAASRIRIVRAGAQAFLGVAALDRVAWRQTRRGRQIPDGEHAWRHWCSDALTWVACRAGRVVGAITAFPCVDGKYCLHKVMVAEHCRGQGVAARLMAALLKEIDRRGADVFLTVDPSNQPALRLYERWGFTTRRFVRGYYRKREDRYVLTRRTRRVGDAD